MVTGHANQVDELDLKRRLGDLSKGRLSELDQLETALILVEPFHQEDRALQMLRDLLERNSDAESARLWYAYLLAHHCMDPASLESERSHLQLLMDSRREIKAAALQLLGYVENELGESDLVDHLQESVRLCPSWVTNRWLLAEALLESGASSAAEQHLHRALDNYTGGEPLGDRTLRDFDDCFVGKHSSSLRQEIERRLAELKAGPGPSRTIKG